MLLLSIEILYGTIISLNTVWYYYQLKYCMLLLSIEILYGTIIN